MIFFIITWKLFFYTLQFQINEKFNCFTYAKCYLHFLKKSIHTVKMLKCEFLHLAFLYEYINYLYVMNIFYSEQMIFGEADFLRYSKYHLYFIYLKKMWNETQCTITAAANVTRRIKYTTYFNEHRFHHSLFVLIREMRIN